MRWSALLGGLGVVCGALILGAGFVWSGMGAPPGVVSAGAPGGLITATPTASPATATPLGGTATPTPTTSPTVTATPTECLIYFVDVPPDNPFYTYVRCLSCRGIVGGYPCGGPGESCPGAYYRPGNDVTRGQTSKIVTLAAGLADPVPSSQQTFADVSPGSTFWLYIEQLAGRGIIGGYPCGGPFEPCVGLGSRPYFRPNNEVTRGQLSKIVSGAAGYTETPTGQTFEDVAPGTTFYLYVERIAARGTVGGYPCGGTGEPCMPPGNRPYFRPNNNSTRGQMSKIAANTFFPNCYTPGPTPTPFPTHTPAPTATATASPTPCGGGWNVVASPNVGTVASELFGVGVVSTNNIWSVGNYGTTTATQTLIEHWDGQGWNVVNSPSVGTGDNYLGSLAVVNSSDIWAVGNYRNTPLDDSQTLVEHWNGTAWSVVSSPNAGMGSNGLTGVVAVSANDVWAVGWYNAGGHEETLVEHWNGTQWSVVASPNVGGSTNQFLAVAAVSATDLWAVGYYLIGNTTQTLIARWDGVQWSVVASPNVGMGNNFLWSVAVVNANDAWAVGWTDTPSGQTLTLHWNGLNWSVVPSPNVGTSSNRLEGVVAVSAGDVWAVGWINSNPAQTLTLHWDGMNWSIVPSPNVGAAPSTLSGVAAVSANNIWTVGRYYNVSSGTMRTLVEHYSCP